MLAGMPEQEGRGPRPKGATPNAKAVSRRDDRHVRPLELGGRCEAAVAVAQTRSGACDHDLQLRGGRRREAEGRPGGVFLAEIAVAC